MKDNVQALVVIIAILFVLIAAGNSVGNSPNCSRDAADYWTDCTGSLR